MYTIINGRRFEVKQTGNKFFYWSMRAMRWIPVKKMEVVSI